MALKVLPSYLITITKFNFTLAFAVIIIIKSRLFDDAQNRIKISLQHIPVRSDKRDYNG
jgi:hypothetical protein